MTTFFVKAWNEVRETFLDTKIRKRSKKGDKADNPVKYPNFCNAQVLRYKYLDDIPDRRDNKTKEVEPKSFFKKGFSER